MTNPLELPTYEQDSRPCPLLRVGTFLARWPFKVTLAIAHEHLRQIPEAIGFITSSSFIKLKLGVYVGNESKEYLYSHNIPLQAETIANLP